MRNERIASLKVNRKLNRWFYHSIGKGGNLVDFAILYHTCSIPEILENIACDFCFNQPSLQLSQSTHGHNKTLVLYEFATSSVSVLNHLKQRHSLFEIADKYTREVQYQFQGKIYYAIGSKNDAGGYELRNPYFKNSSAPKSFTIFKNASKKTVVFESFFDFLSFIVLHQNRSSLKWDFCIPNSLSFSENTRSLLEQYDSIHLFLDNDTAGQNCSQTALKLDRKYISENTLYACHIDLNEWLISASNASQANSESIPP